MPTDAEWEYACRAGTATSYSFGDDAAPLDQFGWYDKNSAERVQDVGRKRPNPFGLLDMHGSVWEWCQDYYNADWYRESPAVDPTGSASGDHRVIRGGNWFNSATHCRSAYRNDALPTTRRNKVGFRVVQEMAPNRAALPAEISSAKTAPAGQE